MATYSHSRVSTFENCPYKYKLRYIDRTKVDTQTTIEAFLGDMVHKTLEKLYKDKKFQKKNSKEELINFYNELWDNGYSESILIVKANQGLTSENYKKMGIKFIEDYYDRMEPFEQMIILGLETQDRMTLPNGDQWHVRIDKLGCDQEGNYYVCDYKTNSRMKDQEEADSDRQLALYSVWVKDKFRDAKTVKLVWHMLAFNKDAISERNDEQLNKLQEDVVELINEIKEAEEKKNFPTNVGPLCDYCEYKFMCPSFRHQVELETKLPENFKDDEGVNFVDELAEIKNKLKELDERKKELEIDIIEFAKQREIDVVYGSNMKCSVKEFDRLVLPVGEDKNKFIELIKKKGLYEDCSMVCYPKLNSRFIKGEVDEDLKNLAKIEKDFRLTLSKKIEEEE